MHLFTPGGWQTIDRDDRVEFLRHYLLRRKPVERIATRQYGFTDAIGFSAAPLPE